MNRNKQTANVFLMGSISIAMLLSSSWANDVAGVEDVVQFDVPAAASVVTKTIEDRQRVVEVKIPISMERIDDRQTVDEINIEVLWNGRAFPIVDYAPKTAMHSMYEGNLSIEKRADKNNSIGLKLSSGYSSLGAGAANAQLSSKHQDSIRYNEIPQQEILISSGTLKRGTGVSFHFHPSRTTTLEGSRELIVAFAVPEDWRAGVLTLKCLASGTRKTFGSFTEKFEYGVAFVMPVYLKGDDQARQFANDFVKTEKELRDHWQRHLSDNATSDSFADQLNSLFSGRKERPAAPTDWVNGLIQSGNDNWLKKYRRHVPPKIASRAGQFVEARNNLVELRRE